MVGFNRQKVLFQLQQFQVIEAIYLGIKFFNSKLFSN